MEKEKKKFSREPERKMIGGERRGKIGQKAKKCGKAIKDDIKAHSIDEERKHEIFALSFYSFK